MSLQLDLGVLISLILTVLGFLFGGGKLLMAQVDRRQTERDDKQEEQIKELLLQIGKQADCVNRLEHDFLRFQGELPLAYVRREDYVRNQTVIEAKLDAVANKIEALLIKGHHHD